MTKMSGSTHEVYTSDDLQYGLLFNARKPSSQDEIYPNNDLQPLNGQNARSPDFVVCEQQRR